MLWTPNKTEDEARARMQKTIEYQKTNDLTFTVYEKKSGEAIGFAGMCEIKNNIFEDTGIAIGPLFVRKGYGKQILMELVRIAFKEKKAKLFEASCRRKNLASKQLILSCGFRYSHSENRIDPHNQEPYTLDFYNLSNVAL